MEKFFNITFKENLRYLSDIDIQIPRTIKIEQDIVLLFI